ncbi:MAG: universal stress protein, partial [Nitrospirota bacterium]
FPDEAMEFLRPLARGIVREVVLAHVVEAGTVKEVQQDFESAAEANLSDYAREFEKQGLKATVHVHRGEAPSGIIEIAVEEKVGMVIMPSRSRSASRAGGPSIKTRVRGSRGGRIGSVAEEMLKHSPTPVIFLPKPYQSALRAA